MDFDLVVANGTVVDGSGQPRFRADVGIRAGRISAVSPGEPLTARETLDARGLVVAPGFIDVHSHSDWVLPLPDHDQILAPLLLQGITTLVTGQCGLSPAPVTDQSIPLADAASEAAQARPIDYRWRSLAEFLDTLQADGLLLNAAFLVGHGTLRHAVLGSRAGAPTPEELNALRQLTRQALRDGAYGFSVGLAYAPGVFARSEELLELLRVVEEEGGVFAAHGRAYSWVSSLYRPMFLGAAHNKRSVVELLDLARHSGTRLQLSHQIFVGRRTWRTHRAVLREIEDAANDGLDVAFDAYPYTYGNTTVNVIFPEWFLDGFLVNINDPPALKRLNRELDLLRLALGLDYKDIVLLWGCAPELVDLEGLDFGTIARRLALPHFEAYAHVARISQGKARVLLNTYSGDEYREEPLRAALSHPLCAFMTDTFLTGRGKDNPASYGTFPRLLGHYSRDLELFPLEEAVRRMTSFPAERTGLAEVGRIAEGLRADLVLFDPETVAGNASLAEPDAPPAGIKAVLIGGQPVAQDGRRLDGKRCGQVFRRG